MKAKTSLKKVVKKIVKKVAESGHAKNVANLGTLISAAKSYGTIYNPANTRQSIANMESSFTSGTDDKNAVFTKLKPYQDVIALRRIHFKELSPLLTRVLGASKSLELSDDSILKIKGYIRKVRGARAVAIVVPETTTPVSTTDAEPDQTGTDKKTHSVAQTSHTNIVDHMIGLNSVLLVEPLYIPNETDLTTTKLTAVITTLEKDNKDSDAAFFNLNAARTKRNVTLYSDKSGIVDVGNGAKEYIKSIFGIKSSQYREISKIVFKPFINEL